MEHVKEVALMEDEVLADDVPNIESTPLAMEYKPGADGLRNPVNYADLPGFEAEYLKREAEAVREIEQNLEHGEYFVNMLYCFRSSSRALPMVTKDTTGDKAQIHSKTFAVLRPEILKMRDLKDFHVEVIDLFCNQVEVLSEAARRKLPVPSQLYGALVALVDLLQKLDNLKDMKACLQNDFSFYKRSFQHARSEMTAEEGERVSMEVHDLQMFLSNPAHPKGLIFHNLKDAVARINNKDGEVRDVLIDLLNHVLAQLEQGMHVLPDEKWALLRVVPHLMLLLDEPGPGFNVFTSKKVALSRVQKLFKSNPVVPVYGDMSIKMIYILGRAHHWDEEKLGAAFGANVPEKVRLRYSLEAQWTEMREQCDEYCPRLVNLMNEIRKEGAGAAAVMQLESGMPPKLAALAKRTLETAREGILLLSSFSSNVLQQAAWKYQNPASEDVLSARGVKRQDTPGFEYERVVRYNYSAQERSIVVDCISLVKSLSGLLMTAESAVAPLLRGAIYNEVQSFLQHQAQSPGVEGEGILTLLHRMDKRKRAATKDALLHLRAMGADWTNYGDSEKRERMEDYKKKRGDREAMERDHLKLRGVPPSPTQLFLLRAATEVLFSDRAQGQQAKGPFSKKDFGAEEVGWMRDFWRASSFFPYLLDLGGTIQRCADLADLWYREFFLEMTKQVQFPIAMSLPWLLTEHVIENPSALTSHMVENILYCMDIYNDAAHRALNSLHQQYIFAEIEAEVNLCFDQLVYLTSENVYSYFKNVAASRAIDAEQAAALERARGSRYLEIPKRRFEVPLLQRHVQLLGRSVDLGRAIAHYLQVKLQGEIDVAFRHLESKKLSYLPEFVKLLSVIRATHELLSERVTLDDFDVMLSTANESLSPAAFRGRIVKHVLLVVVYDLLPHFSFNTTTQRFVRSPIELEGLERLDLEKAPPRQLPNVGFGTECKHVFDEAHKLYREFVGAPHVEALLSLLGRAELTLLVDEVCGHIQHVLEELRPYVAALAELVPPCKLPKYVYKHGGCFAFFEGKLRSVLGYTDLKTKVFQSFREIGNGIAFLHMVDEALNAREACTAHFGAALAGGGAMMGVSGADAEAAHASALSKAVQPFAQGSGSACAPEVLTDLGFGAGAGSQPLFSATLRQLQRTLRDSGLAAEWCDPYGGEEGQREHNSLFEVDQTSEFYRLWSALQFMFCMEEAEATVSDEEEFGDGFAWGGCAVMHLLGQADRFELLDFAYHVCNVAQFDGAADRSEVPEAERPAKMSQGIVGAVEGMDIQATKFVQQALLVRTLNSTILRTLRGAHVSTDSPNHRDVGFLPPEDDTDLNHFRPQQLQAVRLEQVESPAY